MSLQDISYADHRPQPGIAYIYALCDPITDEIRYIGKTCDIAARYAHHVGDHLKQKTHKTNWIQSLLSIGISPKIFVLEAVCESEWPAAERQWIAYARSHDCRLTNMQDGGEGSEKGRPLSAEHRANIGRANKGKVRSQELRDQWSAVRKGRPGHPCSDESRRKISAAKSGYKYSDEAKANMGKSRAGIPLTDEHRMKIAAALDGRKFSEAHRKSIGDGVRGRKLSEETKRKISESRLLPKSSKHVGVHLNAITKKWVARIQRNGKRVTVGSFSSEDAAAQAIAEFMDGQGGRHGVGADIIVA